MFAPISNSISLIFEYPSCVVSQQYNMSFSFLFFLIQQQFWGTAEKDTSRLDSAIFEDLNRYCWNQQTNGLNGGINNSQTPINTDGQIYTLTVLNGSEQWLRKDNNDNQTNPSLDLDTLLGNFQGYVKSEYDDQGYVKSEYDDSGFGTEHKDDGIIMNQQGQQQASQQQQQTIVINSSTNMTNYTTNNNNDWHIADHNNTEQVSLIDDFIYV